MSKELVINQFGLEKGSLTFSEQANAFLSKGYTSQAGNTYFNALRFAEGIVIKENIGQGYAYPFLNGIRIYSLKDKELIADEYYHCLFYSKSTVKQKVVNLLMGVLRDAAINQGVTLIESEAEKQIERMIDQAININQIEMLEKQGRKYLN